MTAERHGQRPWTALDRRDFLRLAGAAGAVGSAGSMLAACTAPSSAGQVAGKGATIGEYVPGPQPASGGRYGGTVGVVWSDPPNSLDPAVGYNLTAWDCITNLVFFGGLLAYDKQFGGPVPNIAAAMPVLSDGNKTLTFTLKPGVKFHNGRAVTASDFKYSWERMLDPKLASWATSYVSSIVGASAMTAGKAAHLDGVLAPDDRTLVVHLTDPDFSVLNAFALPMTAAVPQEEVERLGSTRFGQTPVGTGPFKIVSYDSAGGTARFERNSHYMYAGLPYLDAVTYHWGVDPQIQLLQLEKGDVDILGPGIPSGQAAQVLASPTLKPLARQRPSPGNIWLTMYLDKAPFSSKLVRQALNWAINRAEIGRVTYGTNTPWGAPFPQQIADFTTEFTPYGYDPARARQLLARAGYASGLSLTLTVNADDPFPAIAQIVQQQYGAVGVHLTLNQVSANALSSLEVAEPTGGGHLQMSTDDWYQIQPTPADEVDALYTAKASDNYNGYANPDVDRLAARARQTFDTVARNKLYAQIQKLIGEDAPFVFLGSTDWLAGVTRRVGNYQYRGETYSYYDRMWV